ncbi:MAG: VanZ family protein [Gemmatimonadetes bacterium]|nr:VanZ family protein [Gemmatimonadota bacterium]
MSTGPDVVAWQALFMVAALAFVMLVLPWLLVRDSARAVRHRDAAGERRLFASDREKRLWLWTSVVVLAIYLTLSPAQTLAAALRERGLLGPFTWLVLGSVGAVALVRWVKTRPGTHEIGAALGVTVVYFMTLIRLPVPEARSHLFEYGLVGMLVYQALLERKESGRRVPAPALLAVVATSILGWLDEVIQEFLPTRVYDLRDVAFNALAAAMAVSAVVLVRWARRRWGARH